MRRVALVLVSVLLLTASSSVTAFPQCVLCTLIAALLEQVAIEQNMTIKDAINNLCTDVTKDLPFLDGICEIAGDLIFQAALQKCVNDNVSPDDCCIGLGNGWCDATTTCRLFKQWPPAVSMKERHLGPQLLDLAAGKKLTDLHPRDSMELIRNLAGISAYFDLPKDTLARARVGPFGINHDLSAEEAAQNPDQLIVGDTPIPVADHLPLVDHDKDYFSPIGPLRGFHWRGMDCNDDKGDIYPGRDANNYGPDVDHNCNGINGTDSQGRSYEELFCAGTQPRGIINLGDSVTAHFRIPDYYFRPKYINASTYTNLLPLLEDEADWPLCSWGTGFAPAEMCPYSKLAVDSLALKLRANNLCNHRDYQNIGVNGARVGSMAPPNGIVTTIHNRTGVDNPAVVFYALVGNDVCGSTPDFSRMTTPAEFEAAVLSALTYLDAALAPNSYVIFVGLVDGRILWNTLKNETHPIGVPYPDFYSYLNCYQTSFCWGWTVANETERNMTWTDHAAVLNDVYPKIISENSYNNFEMFYVPPDLDRIINRWVGMGGHARDLIEPVDGFHPSQTGNVLLAQQLWMDLQANFSQAIGPENPNNAQITAIFGDQGGYGPMSAKLYNAFPTDSDGDD